MRKIAQITRQNLWFLIPFAIIWITATLFALSHDKAATHLWLNSHHTPLLDLFFKNYTETGGSIPFIVIAIALFIHYRNALFLTSTFAVSSGITSIFKHIFNAPRPSVYFDSLNIPLPPVVDGVALHHSLSFPSGHTTAAFAIFLSISILCKYRWEKVLCLILALLAAYSRIYLSQHFLQDTLAGSFIGAATALLLAPLFFQKQWGNDNLIITTRKYTASRKKQ